MRVGEPVRIAGLHPPEVHAEGNVAQHARGHAHIEAFVGPVGVVEPFDVVEDVRGGLSRSRGWQRQILDRQRAPRLEQVAELGPEAHSESPAGERRQLDPGGNRKVVESVFARHVLPADSNDLEVEAQPIGVARVAQSACESPRAAERPVHENTSCGFDARAVVDVHGQQRLFSILRQLAMGHASLGAEAHHRLGAGRHG